jgi:hypothetical protein
MRRHRHFSEMTNEVLNDETLETVAGGIWDDGGCIPDILGKLLQKILHPSKPGGPINAGRPQINTSIPRSKAC